MTNVLGRYENGHAYVDFVLHGTNRRSLNCTGLIDTGFTGFVQLHMRDAITLGLPPLGTARAILADGRAIVSYTAVGTAQLNDSRQIGVVVLSETSTLVVVGMEFLRTFGMGLYLTRDAVLLFDHPVAEGE